MSQLLQQIQTHAVNVLKQRLTQLFDGADDWLFKQVDACADARSQQEYLDMMRLLRLQRGAVIDDILRKIVQQFQDITVNRDHVADSPGLKSVSLDHLSLVGHEEMEQNVALDNMVNRARATMDLPLQLLQARLNALLPNSKVTPHNNPLDPKCICEALSHSVKSLDWDIKQQLIFFKLFQLSVFSGYESLVAETNEMLLKAGVLKDVNDLDILQANHRNFALPKQAMPGSPRLVEQSTATDDPNELPNSPEHPAPVARNWETLLTGALASLHQPDVFGLGQSVVGSKEPQAKILQPGDLMALLQQLQTPLQAPGQSQLRSESNGHYRAQEILSHLDSLIGQQHAAEPARIDQVDTNIINLVALLFEHVLDDSRLPQRVKAEIGRLQIPYIRVAVTDPAFLQNSKHPARCLINELAKAGAGLNEAQQGESDVIFNQIHATVHTILDEYRDDIGLIESTYWEFQRFMEQENKRARMVAQRVTALEEGKLKNEQAKQDVSQALQPLIDQQEMPEVMAMLLDQAWFSYLCWIHHRQGKGSDAWNRALYIVQQMLCCLEPVTSEQEALQRSAAIEDVLCAIKQGCDQIAYSELTLQQWLPELEAVFRQQACYEAPDVHPGAVTPGLQPSLESGEASGVAAKSVAEPADAHKPAQCQDKDSDNNEAQREQSDCSQSDCMQIARSDIPDPVAEKLARLKAPRLPQQQHKVTRLDVSKKAPQVTAKELPPLPDDDPGLQQAKQLTVGALLEYSDAEETVRCKLAAHIKSVDRLIFVNNQGAKLFEKNLLEAAHDINAGRLSLLEDSMLFDRALEVVIGSLRNVREQAG